MANFKENDHQQEHDWVRKYKNIGQVYGIGSDTASAGMAKSELASDWDSIDIQLRRAKAKINQLLS